jgi:hypothetical protein
MAYVCGLAESSDEPCRWRVLGFDSGSLAVLATVCGTDDRLVTVDHQWTVRAWDLRTLALLAQGGLPFGRDSLALPPASFRLFEGFGSLLEASDRGLERIDRCWLVRSDNHASVDAHQACAGLISIRHGGGAAPTINCTVCALQLPLPASKACMLGTLDGRRLVISESHSVDEAFRVFDRALQPTASKPLWDVELLQDSCHSAEWFRRLGHHPFACCQSAYQ